MSEGGGHEQGAKTDSMSTRRTTRASTSGSGGNDEGDISTHPQNRRTRGSTAGISSRIGKAAVVGEVTEEMIVEERNRLLLQKQTELDQIFDRHDDLVREKFHMEHWRSMLSYNPVVAKTDTSHVYQEYKLNHDLVRAVEPAAGPSRQTRRAMIERKHIISAPVLSISVPPKTSHSKKSQSKDLRPHASTSSAVVGKGKGKERETPTLIEDVVEEAPEAETSASTTRSRKYRNLPRSSSLRLSQTPIPHPEQGTSQPLSISILQRKSSVKRPPEPPEPTTAAKSKKKLKASDGKGVDKDPTLPCSLPAQEAPQLSLGRALRSRQETAHNANGAQDPPLAETRLSTKKQPIPRHDPPPSPESRVKRIKLVVRKPMPTYTHPAQIPDAPQFNNSLEEYLNSYATTLRPSQIKKIAAIREKEAAFRRAGRFIPGTDMLFGTKIDGNELPALYAPPESKHEGPWEHILQSVVAHHEGRTPERWPQGKHVVAQVVACMQGYWDAQAAKREKARLQEERKLRVLAKATVKAVVNEWKRAVHHIREQERRKEEEEERRRGHEHLDAILDQSGQLLSTQQSRLRRGETTSSRASSILDGLAGWGRDSDDETDEEDSKPAEIDEEGDQCHATEAVEGEEEEEEDDGRDEDVEASLSMILGDPPPPSTPEPGPSQGEVPEPSTAPSSQATPVDNSSDDEDGAWKEEMDHLMVPDPESSPRRGPPSPPSKIPLVDYASSTDTPHPTPAKQRDVSLPLPPSLPDIAEDALPTPMVFEEPTLSSPTLEPGDQPPTITHSATASDVPDPSSPVGVGESGHVEQQEQNNHGAEVPQDVEMQEDQVQDEDSEHEEEAGADDSEIPEYLKPFAVAPVDYDPSAPVKPPLLLRGTLRPYQQAGLEWLASLHTNNLNGILADEMGLGKTIQTIALLAHLACDRGIWGPHLIVVPTSVILNWEMEFKKFLPGFKVLSYHGGTTRRKELRRGWLDKYNFNVCITSYTLASRDQLIFKRKAWYYMILDEAHMIKNFRSQRWNVLLMFRSWRRLLLTGTPLQNNLTELWALLQFLMSGSTFANLKEFSDWFSNPLEKAVEMSNAYDEETLQRASKLHTVLRPYLLRRLKRDVEKELPQKYEHLVLCPLSKRQRYLYDEFMSRATTRQDLQSGVYLKIANILMQLRKVCNHPDLFEVRPIVTSFAMRRSAIADFEIKELLIRKRWMEDEEEGLDLDLFNLRFTPRQSGVSQIAAKRIVELDATARLPFYNAILEDPPPKDTRTIAGFRRYKEWEKKAESHARWSHIAYVNRLRCSWSGPVYSDELLNSKAAEIAKVLYPLSRVSKRSMTWDNRPPDATWLVNVLVQSYEDREAAMAGYIDRFAFVTPPVVALDLPRLAVAEAAPALSTLSPRFDRVLHRASVKLQIAFPDPSLLQYDCGKLQRLAELLREKKAGGHRVLIFTQMTRILDILEIFLNHHGYLYLRLDGATKIEDRQYITERFNADPRVFCFISSSRSGGVGINLTGADTVVFYDSDFNPQMDRQCEDRAHRIGQIRDVHIYRFVSEHTVEEAMLRKANQKRSLDDLVIQKGEFDWRTLLNNANDDSPPASDTPKADKNNSTVTMAALTKALAEYDDADDARAAAMAAEEAFVMEGADEVDLAFGDDSGGQRAHGGVDAVRVMNGDDASGGVPRQGSDPGDGADDDDAAAPGGEDSHGAAEMGEDEEKEGGTTVDYMVSWVQEDWDFFREWKV